MYNFDSYNILLVIATNIAVQLMTASVLQGHDVQHNNPACSGHFTGSQTLSGFHTEHRDSH